MLFPEIGIAEYVIFLSTQSILYFNKVTDLMGLDCFRKCCFKEKKMLWKQPKFVKIKWVVVYNINTEYKMLLRETV